MSPFVGDTHHAPVRPRPALPFDTQRSVGPRTRICPRRDRPFGLPRSRTSVSRATSADARGHGWFARHVPSCSRAAIPARRSRGPSRHHTGPSPSHTRAGVQSNGLPAGIAAVASNTAVSIRAAVRDERCSSNVRVRTAETKQPAGANRRAVTKHNLGDNAGRPNRFGPEWLQSPALPSAADRLVSISAYWSPSASKPLSRCVRPYTTTGAQPSSPAGR